MQPPGTPASLSPTRRSLARPARLPRSLAPAHRAGPPLIAAQEPGPTPRLPHCNRCMQSQTRMCLPPQRLDAFGARRKRGMRRAGAAPCTVASSASPFRHRPHRPRRRRHPRRLTPPPLWAATLAVGWTRPSRRPRRRPHRRPHRRHPRRTPRPYRRRRRHTPPRHRSRWRAMPGAHRSTSSLTARRRRAARASFAPTTWRRARRGATRAHTLATSATPRAPAAPHARRRHRRPHRRRTRQLAGGATASQTAVAPP